MEILESRQLFAFEGEDFDAYLESLLTEVLALETCDGLPERLSGYKLEISCPFTAVDAATAALRETPAIVLTYGFGMGIALSSIAGIAAAIPVATITSMITGINYSLHIPSQDDGRVFQNDPIADAVFFHVMTETAIALSAPYFENFGVMVLGISALSLAAMPFTIVSAYGDSQKCHADEVADYLNKVRAICEHKPLLKEQAMAAAF